MQIDLTKNPAKPILKLAKPDKTIVGILNDAYDIVFTPKLGGINELIFKIPLRIDINHKLCTNPNVDNIKFWYLIKFEIPEKNYAEWFIVVNPKGSSTHKEYHCFSLAYELSNKFIKNYTATSLNASEVLDETILTYSTWTIDYIDPDFDLRYRGFNVAQSTLLNFLLNDISDAYNALIFFDTENRKISLYHPQNIGLNRGLRFSYGKYLKEINSELDHNNFCTRLRPYGQNGLGIQPVSVTGQNWIENFGVFMYPFEQDEQGNVIKHSDYFTDSLAKAQMAYEEKINTTQPIFADLLGEKNQLLENMAEKDTELIYLYQELFIILDQLDIAQANGDSTSALIQQKNAKQSEINIVESNAADILADIYDVESQMFDLQDELSLEKNFTVEQIKERDRFIVEKSFENQYCFDAEELLELAQEKFAELQFPPLLINIDVVNFLEILECQMDWDKLSLHLGDIVEIKYPQLNLHAKAKIIEATFEYETGNIKLVIANIKNIHDEDKILALLNKSASSSATVDMSRFKWDGVENVENQITNLLTQTWEAANIPLSAAAEGSLTIDGRGLTSINHAPPIEPISKGLRIMHGALVTTTDGFNTVGVAVDGTGVYGERLVGKIIAGINLTIENEAGTFRVDKDGVTITGASLTVTNGIPDSQIASASLWNSKKRVFISQPTIPYDVGDLWADNGIIKVCKTAQSSGSFSATDWEETNSGTNVFTAQPTTPYKKGDLWAKDDGQIWVCIIQRLTGDYVAGDWSKATSGDTTQTIIDGGIVTTGRVEVKQGGTVAAGITGEASGDTAVRFWAGSTFANRANAPFKVTQGGALTATSGTIGGWTIDGTAGLKYGTTNATAKGITTGTYAFYAGNLTPSSAPFYVTQEGKLYASNVDIRGSVNATSGNFQYINVYDAWLYDVVIDSGRFYGDGVYNNYGGAARWKYTNYAYLYQNSDEFRVFINGDEQFQVNHNGIAKAYGFQQYSTVKRKENIISSNTNALSTIANTKIYEYNYKNTKRPKERKRHIGPIAEDLPEILTTDHDGDKCINLGDMIGLLWKAVQELNQKIDGGKGNNLEKDNTETK